MLLELALWLSQDIRGFNVFGYICLLYTSDAADDLTRVDIVWRLIHKNT